MERTNPHIKLVTEVNSDAIVTRIEMILHHQTSLNLDDYSLSFSRGHQKVQQVKQQRGEWQEVCCMRTVCYGAPAHDEVPNIVYPETTVVSASEHCKCHVIVLRT